MFHFPFPALFGLVRFCLQKPPESFFFQRLAEEETLHHVATGSF
jgi:hypothetical protein